ncbi:Glutaredoxin-like protein NrdH [Bacillus sp. THAF10]|uniref:glutaredoxin family protein n=1 Tax=Bacillus sp. THAF10 TaxID=2587848 RepID=UPI0012A8BBC2|nr:glutaredoxin family protein [Bacillus sp. THAF10]QFT87625.1 Glutaredoxin-like protein NrdH [Bacillus sp. THAF10]
MLTLYTIDGCIRCQKARLILNQHGIRYNEKNLLHEPEAAKELLSLIGEVRAPVLKSDHSIWIGKELLDYFEEESNDEFKDRTSK